MAVLRDRPYVQFNFLVDLGTGNTEGPEAGFQEMSNIGMEVTVSEYRTGNSKENSVRKITGLNKATDVTLKRGVIGDPGLFDWLNGIRGGRAKAPDRRNLAVEQFDEAGRKTRSVTLLSCRVLDFQAVPDDEADANAFAVTKLTLKAEGSRQDQSAQTKSKNMRRKGEAAS